MAKYNEVAFEVAKLCKSCPYDCKGEFVEIIDWRDWDDVMEMTPTVVCRKADIYFHLYDFVHRVIRETVDLRLDDDDVWDDEK